MLDTLTNVLRLPACYQFFERMVGGANGWPKYLGEFVQPVAGEKVLDLGCGPADVLAYLPEVDYTGLDISAEYIAAAKQRFGTRGRFWCGDVGLASIAGEQGTFDLVLASGVLHHLDDATAGRLLDLARHALRPSGRLVTLDGCYVPEQSSIARWLLRRDRGRFVRTPDQYQRLAAAAFSHVDASLRHDLLRVPYSHLIMRCRTPL